MMNENAEPATTHPEAANKFSGADDEVRALRDRVRAAKARVETAMLYTMWSEVRVELRAAHAELVKVLADVGA